MINLIIGDYMSRKSELLSAEVLEIAKAELKKLGAYGYVSKKLTAVIAAGVHGIKDVAKIYGISRNTLTEWVRCISNKDLDKLKAPKERCRPRKLKDDQMLVIEGWIASDPMITSKALMLKIKEFFGISVSMMTAHRIIKRLEYSYITPRPRHYKQDKEKVEEFKKKSKGDNR
jgi:transposase